MTTPFTAGLPLCMVHQLILGWMANNVLLPPPPCPQLETLIPGLARRQEAHQSMFLKLILWGLPHFDKVISRWLHCPAACRA